MKPLGLPRADRCSKRDAQGNKLSNELAGIDRVDEQVQLARDFINQVIADANAARGGST